jgi:hypothetical protein
MGRSRLRLAGIGWLVLLVLGLAGLLASAARAESLTGSLTTRSSLIRAAAEPAQVRFSGVLRTAEGQPVPGVSVSVSNSYGGGSAKTNSEGGFSFMVAAGTDTLVVRGESAPVELHLPHYFYVEASIVIEHETQDQIVLPQSVGLTVHVLDRSGNPIEGAQFEPEPSSESQQVSSYDPVPGVSTGEVRDIPTSASTDANGDATIYTFPAASLPANVSAGAAGDAPLGYHSEHLNINAEHDGETTVTLAALVRFSGSVRTAEGRPAASTYVSVDGTAGETAAYVNSEGDFSFEVAAGTNTVTMSGYDGLYYHLPNSFEFTASVVIEHEVHEEISLPRTVAVTAHALDDSGNPLANVSFYTASASGWDQVGSFEPLPGVSSALQENVYGYTEPNDGDIARFYTFSTASLEVTVSDSNAGTGAPRGYRPQTLDIDAEQETETTVTLYPATPVQFSGILLTAAGQPVPYANMQVDDSAGGTGVNTNVDGDFSMEVLAGADVLQVQGGGFPSSLHLPSNFNLEAPMVIEHDARQEITLPRTVALTAHVLDNGGKSIEGAQLEPSYVEADSYEPMPGVTTSHIFDVPSNASTNPKGYATIYAFPTTNPLEIRVNAPAGYVSQTVTVNAEHSGEVTVRLSPDITQSPQSITFGSVAPEAPTAGSVYRVEASASSELPVTLSLDPSSTKNGCVLSGSLVEFKKAGECVVDANQPGDSSFLAAPQAQQAITVTAAKATTTTTFSLSTSALTYGEEQAERVTATVSAAGGGMIPRGRVAVMAGARVLCRIKLVDGTGSCSPKARALNSGAYSVTASFAGTPKFGSSTSSSAPLEVS